MCKQCEIDELVRSAIREMIYQASPSDESELKAIIKKISTKGIAAHIYEASGRRIAAGTIAAALRRQGIQYVFSKGGNGTRISPTKSNIERLAIA